MTCAVMFSAAIAGRSTCVAPQPAAKAAATAMVVAVRFMENVSLWFLGGRCYVGKARLPRLLKSASQARHAALSYDEIADGGNHEGDQACCDAIGVAADVESCDRTNQGHHCRRGRRLPVLSADR